jgi:CCR4-NOT transcription complex subunit 4
MTVFELSMDVDEDCPLCCDPLGHDLNFFPCQCGFQLCSMCWHKIKEDKDKEPKCPNCRKLYGDEPFQFSPLSEQQSEKLKQITQKEKPLKPPQNTGVTKVTDPLNREKLSQVRVMQKNLVFVVGLSAQLADEKVLRKSNFLGKFGKIMKVAVNQATGPGKNNHHHFHNGNTGPSASAYVTYSTTEAALSCIQKINGQWESGRTLKATLGTTKYCSR